MKSKLIPLLVLLVGASVSAQATAPSDPGAAPTRPLDWSEFGTIGTTSGPFVRKVAGSAPGTGFEPVIAIEPLFRPRLVRPVRMEAFAYLPQPSLANVDRDTLEGMGEALQPFGDVPGGVVLGLKASTPEAFTGARLHRLHRLQSNDKGWAIVLSNGESLALPSLPEYLSSLTSFVVNPRRSDALIDLSGDALLWLAPELQSTGLCRLLHKADRAPHLYIPGSAPYKSVIVDRAVRMAEGPSNELVLSADLEVRLYAAGPSSYIRDALSRVATYPFTFTPATAGSTQLGSKPERSLPPGTRAVELEAALRELSHVAAWLGFLRWLHEVDPVGFAQLGK